MNRCLNAAAAAVVLAFAANGAHADDLPASVLSLFNRIPELPSTAQEATRWVDKQGKLVHPGLLALKADIQAHLQAVERIAAVVGPRDPAQGSIVVEDLGKGMADAGIDLARMQRDPAYAQKMQERLRRMSPQEAMAFSQQMLQPMNRDPRYQNAAGAMVDDAPAARAAAAAGESYSQAQLSRIQAQEVIWREGDKAADAIRSEPLRVPAARPAMDWENIGCTAACRAQWEAYASKALPLMIERDTAILQAHRSAIQRQRASVAEGIGTADSHLVATRYGAAARSQVNQMKIIAYDGAAIGDLTYLVDRIVDSVRSAAAVAHCGKQIVLAPRAVCR